MTTSDAGEPRVTIGDVHGSNFAIGHQAHAETHQHAAPARDEATEELLAAVRKLREDLRVVRSDAATAALDAELADTEAEITSTGTAGRTRRERLRELLADSQALLTVLASAGAVATMVGL
ncbi:hypothetical protein [Streptomyces sp. cg40]|jgi:hypothetical protein|uniref:hypothetical protein n=1 Tax=Streptomyces sp. cg40 TaxID=3419764 RepID=UPI003CFC2D63